MSEPKISVIIPVYNVEPYLRRCLESVVSQTYKNIEIILVDDGSKDKCGFICDEYAVRDSRIKVIHKENGGLSSACNAGLSAATGDWIGWVDSDDWAEQDMFEYMLYGATKYNADAAVCSRYEWAKNRRLFRGWKDEIVLDKEHALKLLLEDREMNNFRWDKLWKRSFFSDIEFPEGHMFEDVSVMYKLFEKAEKIVCLPGAKYNYIYHAGSILGRASLKSRMDHYFAARKRYDDMIEHWPQFKTQLEGQCIISAIGIWSCCFSSDKKQRNQYAMQIKELSTFCQMRKQSAKKYLELGPTGRIVLYLTSYTTWWAFAVSWLCGRIYRWKYGRML